MACVFAICTGRLVYKGVRGAHLQIWRLPGCNGQEFGQTSCNSDHDERRIAAAIKHGSRYVNSHLPATQTRLIRVSFSESTFR